MPTTYLKIISLMAALIWSSSSSFTLAATSIDDILTGDQCNYTSQCKALFGDIANDCADSRSDNSVCMCGSTPCLDLIVTPEPTPTPIVVVNNDECNTTAECKTIWGNTANDCKDSKSTQSVCMCGSQACSVVFGIPTPFPTAIPTPVATALPTPIPISTPSIDQCNKTSECKAIWGNTANDCKNSQSAQSICMCGSAACSDVFATPPSPFPTPIPTATPSPNGNCDVSGVMEQWHRIAVTCGGYSASENDNSTFTDIRFNVAFTQGSQTITVPGHFAADGNAADSGATGGDKWRAYFSAPSTGVWNYTVSFRTGNNIAVDTSSNPGSAVTGIHGLSGSFNVSTTGAASNDMRSRGLLQHKNGERYLRFVGDNSIYIEGGMDSPENIFGYSEFDNTTKYSGGSCKGILHSFDAHTSDWNTGDPTWKDGKGKSLIGLVNYIASRDVNAMYIMMNTVTGDGCDAHPWLTYNSNGTEKRFDVSKLDQWERVLAHMTANGIMIHAMTQETENDQLLNDGNLGLERKLYYRELISRFAHHPALQWNIGEENTNTSEQVKSFSDYIKQVDPYDHPIVMHTYPSQHDRYDDLFGHSTFDGATIQFSGITEDASGSNGAYGTTVDILTKSINAGQPWVVTFTEASGNDAPTPNTEVTSLQRIYWMYAGIMAGGGGFEWYLKNAGSGHAYDLAVEDLREFDAHWKQTGYLVRFFRDTLQDELGINLHNLQRDNGITSTTSDWVLADSGKAYVIFLRDGGTTNINLPNNSIYDLLWFNPRTGDYIQGDNLQGSGNQSIGNPPSDISSDWVAVVTFLKTAESGNYIEKDGIVVMEAENTNSNLDLWEKGNSISGYTGSSYLEFTGNTPINGSAKSPLEYTFTVNQDGLYYLHMLVAKETIDGRTDVANDAYVRLDGNYGAGPNVGNSHGDDAPLANLKANTKFYGGNANQFAWSYGNRLDLGGDTNKRVAVYDLKAGETYTFVMHGRSQKFKVDRIVFRHSSVSIATAQDISAAETR